MTTLPTDPSGSAPPRSEADTESDDGETVGPGPAKAATAGGVAGATMGAVVAGPPGALIGAATGAVRGLLFQGVAEKVDEMAAEKGRDIADSLLGPPDEPDQA